jgi:hypothetical protein
MDREDAKFFVIQIASLRKLAAGRLLPIIAYREFLRAFAPLRFKKSGKADASALHGA